MRSNAEAAPSLKPAGFARALVFLVALPLVAGAVDPKHGYRNILAAEKKLYSHAQEELIIRDYFQDRRGGIFLDVGCGHPINDSNTFYLEKHLGWTGIGVDGLPEFARKWARYRPRSKFFNYIATDHAGTMEAFYRAELQVRDISSIEKPKAPGGKPVQYEMIRVPTITLTKLLEQNGFSKIDFLSMDIEGAEPLALAGFEIERFLPQLACVEAKPKNRVPILSYFAEHGYQQLDRYLKYDKTNYYFAPKSGVRSTQ